MINQSDANSLQRITIQITKHQHEMLKHYEQLKKTLQPETSTTNAAS